MWFCKSLCPTEKKKQSQESKTADNNLEFAEEVLSIQWSRKHKLQVSASTLCRLCFSVSVTAEENPSIQACSQVTLCVDLPKTTVLPLSPTLSASFLVLLNVLPDLVPFLLHFLCPIGRPKFLTSLLCQNLKEQCSAQRIAGLYSLGIFPTDGCTSTALLTEVTALWS